jgi:hypothetical protein
MESELLKRIDAAIADLDRASEALGSAALGDILKPVRQAFADRIKALREQLQEDRKYAQTAAQDWSIFESRRQNAAALLLECLAFVQGVLLRNNGFDKGWCGITDRLLTELSDSTDLKWSSFSLPADGESFASLANVVRLRFPSNGIWDLPIAAHEFGHFASTKLIASVPRKDYTFNAFVADLNRDAEAPDPPYGKQQLAFIDEFFADAFATFVLGPAYVRTCLYCRFSPGAANIDSDNHPSYAQRAALILEMLKRMEGDEAGFKAPRTTSHDFWYAALKDAGKEPAANAELNGLAREIVDFLRDAAPHAAYTGWAKAQSLSSVLMKDEKPERLVDKETSVADVINAAWIVRMSGEPADQVSGKARDICNHLAQQPT